MSGTVRLIFANLEKLLIVTNALNYFDQSNLLLKISCELYLQPLKFYLILQHSVHPVHLTLQASATPVVDRGIRQVTPDRLTRDQAATFRPSDLPIGQGHRRCE